MEVLCTKVTGVYYFAQLRSLKSDKTVETHCERWIYCRTVSFSRAYQNKPAAEHQVVM